MHFKCDVMLFLFMSTMCSPENVASIILKRLSSLYSCRQLLCCVEKKKDWHAGSTGTVCEGHMAAME